MDTSPRAVRLLGIGPLERPILLLMWEAQWLRARLAEDRESRSNSLEEIRKDAIGYMSHDPSCDVLVSEGEPPECTCGLWKVLNRFSQMRGR